MSLQWVCQNTLVLSPPGTRLPVNYQAFPYDAYTEKAIVLQWAAAQLLNMQPPRTPM